MHMHAIHSITYSIEIYIFCHYCFVFCCFFPTFYCGLFLEIWKVFDIKMWFKVISHTLTQLAKRKADAIMTEVREAEAERQISPSTTAQVADFLTFLDEIEETVRCSCLIIKCDKPIKQSNLFSFSSAFFFWFTRLHISISRFANKELKSVSKMYDLINVYSVPTPPENLAMLKLCDDLLDDIMWKEAEGRKLLWKGFAAPWRRI